MLSWRSYSLKLVAFQSQPRPILPPLPYLSDAESSGVMYICGIPGTGKTACVMEVLRGLRGRAVEVRTGQWRRLVG